MFVCFSTKLSEGCRILIQIKESLYLKYGRSFQNGTFASLPSLCYGVISGQQTLYWRSLEALNLPNIPTKIFRIIGKSQMNQLETAPREASKVLISSVKCPRIIFLESYICTECVLINH